jgi:hypothetical protein
MALFAPRNRGILLDLVVFVVNLLLVRALVAVAQQLVHAAQEDALTKLGIGLFFAGLLLVQPVGPTLKRWAFHQRSSFSIDSGAGCLLFWFMFVYFVLLLVLTTAAVVLIGAMFFTGTGGEGPSVLAILGGFAWSIVSVVVVYRYFVTPKARPRWAFLTTPRAEHLGDAAMYLNVIGLSILWGTLTASAPFREIVTQTPLGRAGSFTDILGRFIVIGVLALVVYVPGRIFYLAEDKHLRLTLLTMLLANLPLIVRVAL